MRAFAYNLAADLLQDVNSKVCYTAVPLEVSLLLKLDK